MPKHDLTWQTTDVCFLEALFLATGGEGAVSLKEVLLMADAVDGTVLSLAEVTQAFVKLHAVGLILIQKNKLLLTQEALQVSESMADFDDEKEKLKLLQEKKITTESISDAETTLRKYKLKNHYQQYLEQYG